MAAQIAVLILFNAGSHYAVGKMVFSVGTVAIINLALLIGLATARVRAETLGSRFLQGMWLGPIVAASAASALSLAIFDQPMIEDRRIVRGLKYAASVEPSLNIEPQHRTIYFDSRLPAPMNYMISISELHLPRYESKAAFDVLFNRPPVDPSVVHAIVDKKSPFNKPKCMVEGRKSTRFVVVDYPCALGPVGPEADAPPPS
jgi:hypothetical protein